MDQAGNGIRTRDIQLGKQWQNLNQVRFYLILSIFFILSRYFRRNIMIKCLDNIKVLVPRENGACYVRAVNNIIAQGHNVWDAIHAYLTSDKFLKLKPASQNTAIRRIKRALKESGGREVYEDTAAQVRINNFFKAYTARVPRSFRPGRIKSRAQLGLLLTASGTRTSLWMFFLYKSACRISEACNIKLSDVIQNDDETMEILINGKGRKQRYILIPIELFNELRSVFNGKTYLFESQEGRRYHRTSVANLIYEASLRILGFRVSPHDFRKACSTFSARHTRASGGDIKSVMAHTGHSDARVFFLHYVDHEQLKPSAIPEPDWSGERLGYKRYKKNQEQRRSVIFQPQASINRAHRGKGRQETA